MLWVALGALAAAGIAVRLAARRRADHALLWCARALEAVFAAELAKAALAALTLGPARAAGRVPFSGWERAAFAAHSSLTLGAYALPAALCWQIFDEWGGAWLALPWAVCSAVLALAYPALRGDTLLAAQRWVVAGAITLALFAVFFGERPERFRVGRAHLVAVLLLAGPAAELAGPLLYADPVARWALAQGTWTLVLASVVLAASWRRPWAPRRS